MIQHVVDYQEAVQTAFGDGALTLAKWDPSLRSLFSWVQGAMDKRWGGWILGPKALLCAIVMANVYAPRFRAHGIRLEDVIGDLKTAEKQLAKLDPVTAARVERQEPKGTRLPR